MFSRKLYAIEPIRKGEPLTTKGPTGKDGHDHVFHLGVRLEGPGPLGFATKDHAAGERIHEIADYNGDPWMILSYEERTTYFEGPPIPELKTGPTISWKDAKPTPLADLRAMRDLIERRNSED